MPQGRLPSNTENTKQVMEKKLRSSKELIDRISKKTKEMDVELVPQQGESKDSDY